MDSDASFIMLTDDGNTLLSVRQGDDGALELLSTPVTILPSTVDNFELPTSSISDIELNQINLNVPQNNTQTYLASFDVANLESENFGVPNENQLIQETNNLLHNRVNNNENITHTQNTIEGDMEKTYLPEKQVVLKELSVCLEKIRVPTRKHMHKKLGKLKKGNKSERQQPCFKCDLCGEEFRKQYLLQKHLLDHAQDKPHHCPKCPATFNVPMNFTLHMATHNIGVRKCPECGRKFARTTSLKAHMMVHEMDESLYCTECDDTFPTKSQLEAHLSLHKEKWSSDDCRRCRLCGKQFTKPVLYRQHLRDHYKLQMKSSKPTRTGIKHCTSYKCRICSKMFMKPAQLARHIRVHTGEKPYECKVCHKGFTQKDSVRLHMAQHRKHTSYNCSLCNAKFKSKGNLVSHVNEVHNFKRNGQPIYRCTYCTCVFRTLSKRNSHVTLVHKNNINDVIRDLDTCTANSRLAGSTFDEEDGITSVQTTDGEVNAEVDNDNLEEGFVAMDDKENTAIVTMLDKESNGLKGKYVKIRQRVVNNRRFYECTYCKKSFNKPCDLMRHIRIHTNEKPYKCKMCDETFTLKYSLERHEKRHKLQPDVSEESKCISCNESFFSKNDYQKHINKYHKCIKCNKEFTTIEEQKSHSEIHLKEIKEFKKDSTKKKISTEVQNLAKKVVLKDPLVITETGNGLHAQPQYRNETAHGKGRPYKCPACPSAFMKISHYKQHYRSKHIGERPFVCDFCDRAFATKSGLRVHLQIHDSSKPYECHICDSKFKTLNCVKRHYITHTNKRPFMCPYCNKTYKSTFSCKLHMKTHKEEIAQKQLELQRNQSTKSVITDDPITLPPSTSNKQISNTDNMCFAVSLTSNNIPPIAQNIPLVNDPNIGSIQTLHADETSTMTLSNYNGSETFSSENIREIEKQLNQQLLGLGVNLTLGNVLKRNDQQCNASVETSQEQPMLSIIYDNGVTLHSPVTVSASVNPNVYNPTYGNIDISQIALQNNSAMNIGIIQADSANMINILSNATQENQSCSQQIMNGSVGINFVFDQNESIKNNQVIDKPLSNIENTSVVKSIENLDEARNLQCHICNMQQSCASDLEKHLKTHKEKKEFECTYCNFKFRSATGLKQHNKKVHEIHNTFKCYECNQEFKTSLLLKTHIKEHLKKELELKNVENAKEIINELESKDKEKSARKKNKINTCQYCPKTFRKPSDLVRHVRTHTGERPYTCHFCQKSFAIKCTLDSHIKMHNSKKPLTCHVCNSVFSTKGSLTVHMRLHTECKPFKCSICNIDFRTSDILNDHLLSHNTDEKSKEKPIAFGILPTEMETLSKNNQIVNTSISSHDLSHITIEPKSSTQIIASELQNNFEQETQGPMQNVIAQQSMSFDQSLTNMTIPSEITFSTDEMDDEVLTLDENNQLVANLQYLLANGLVTIQTQDLESNQVSLTTTILPADFEKNKETENVAPQVCYNKMESSDSIVPTKFPNENNLDMNNFRVLQLDSVDSTVQTINDCISLKHKKSLNQTSKHVCETCSKSFKKPGLLERHKRTHTGERPFQCDQCQKSFSQKSTLQMHYRNHTGTKPHNCTHCGKSFTQSGNLNTHIKRVHKIDPVKNRVKTKQTTQFLHYDTKILPTTVDDGKSLSLDDLPFIDLLK